MSTPPKRLRIRDEDVLFEDDLLMGGVEHEWVRTPAYKQGHKVSRDGRTAICGRPLLVSASDWEGFRAAYLAHFGKELSPYWYARDTRKGAKCVDCKKEDPFGVEDAETPVPAAPPERSFTQHEVTSSDRLAQARFRSKVQAIAREFNATVEDAA